MFKILISTLLAFQPVFAQNAILNADLIESHDSFKNFTKNPGAEKNKNNVTDAAVIVTRSTSSPLEGAASFSIDASASSQVVKFDAFNLSSYLKGQNCEAKFYYSGDATLYKAYVEQGTTKVTTDLQLLNVTNSQATSIYFPCGDLTSNSHLVIEATGNGAAIKVDKLYIGAATGISNISPVQFVGSAYIPTTASCFWSRTNTALGSFSTTAACPGPTVESNPGPGIIQTTDTDLPKFTVNNMPPGNYMIVVHATVYESSSGGNGSIALSDGTTTAVGRGAVAGITTSIANGNFTAFFTYTTTANRTFEIFGRTDTGSVSIDNAAGVDQTSIQIYRFPLASEQAVSVSQSQFPTIQKFTSGSGTYIKPVGVTHIKVRMVGGGGGGSGSGTAAGGNGGAGGDTTFGSSLLTAGGGFGGVWSSAGGAGGTATINSPAVGSKWDGVRGGGQGFVSITSVNMFGPTGGNSVLGGAGSGAPQNAAGIDAVANSGSGGGGGGGNSAVSMYTGGGGGSGAFVDALITSPSSTYSYSVGAGGSNGAAGTSGFGGGAGAAGYIEVTEYYGVNVPVLIGSVTSNSTGAERVERYIIGSTGGGCSIATTTDTGATGSSPATGKCQITFGRSWSVAPTCVPSVYYTAGTSTFTAVVDAATAVPSTTTVNIAGISTAGSYAAADGFSMTCMGPR